MKTEKKNEKQAAAGHGHTTMPVLFIGHGNPMNAIEDNEYTRAWHECGRQIPRPDAILCISAHWETSGVFVTTMEQPRTIHDFYGFPPDLYKINYPAPGSAELVMKIQNLFSEQNIRVDSEWGLDHGCWSVLYRLYPAADIPVIQLSLDKTKTAEDHYRFAKKLRSLRSEKILIFASGNMVHNLRTVVWQDTAFDWAVDFDQLLKKLIVLKSHDSLINYSTLGSAARLAIPTNEHYLPLLYALALQDRSDKVTFFAEKVTMGSISMRSLRIG
jgi:4,5-DOPA dioxygenase extradiol